MLHDEHSPICYIVFLVIILKKIWHSTWQTTFLHPLRHPRQKPKLHLCCSCHCCSAEQHSLLPKLLLRFSDWCLGLWWSSSNPFSTQQPGLRLVSSRTPNQLRNRGQTTPMVHKALQVWAVVCIFSLITHALLSLSPVHIPCVPWNAHSIVFEVYSAQNNSPTTPALSTLQTATYPVSLSINIASSEEHLLFSPDGGRCSHFHTPRYLCT